MVASDLPSDSNEESNLRLALNEELSLSLGISLVSDELSIGGLVLLEVLLGVGGSELSGLGGSLLKGSSVSDLSLSSLLVSGGLLEERLGDGSLGGTTSLLGGCGGSGFLRHLQVFLKINNKASSQMLFH